LLLILFLALIFSPNLSFAKNAALVIIDMQPLFATGHDYQKDPGNAAILRRILKRQRELIDMAKEKNLPIAVIEYSDVGETNRSLTREIFNYANTETFTKNKDGIFDWESGIEIGLKTFLAKNDVTELIVAGANGNNCVKNSIEGALNAGYGVWADPTAIADFNNPKFMYPYSYEDGTNDMERADLFKMFHQRKNIRSVDEILAAADHQLRPPSEISCSVLYGKMQAPVQASQ
jgi:nicotinamidase-related amidase